MTLLILLTSVSSAKGHIDQRMTAEAEKISRGEKVQGRYLTYYLSQTGLPMKTVYSNVTELLLAGVDTVGTIPLPPPLHRSALGTASQSDGFHPGRLLLPRFPAPCPGLCTSCPATPRCKQPSEQRCWACSVIAGSPRRRMCPACLC